MLMIILPDGGGGKTVEAASFLHLNITFSTGNVALERRIWAKKYTVSNNLGVSYFFLSRSVLPLNSRRNSKEKKKKMLQFGLF